MALLPRSWPAPVLAAAVLATLLATASTAVAADVMLGPGGFEPETVTVDPGEEIVWVNDSASPQTIIGEDGSWDSGPLAAGETFSVALRTAGMVTYGTEDGAHLGQIEVRAAGPTTPSPTAEASGEQGEQVVAMPRTGGALRPAALLAVALLAAGGACLLAAPRPGGPTS